MVDVTNHEPTIDMLLGWLEATVKIAEKVTIEKRSPGILEAIRAILEQHRNIFQRTPSFFELCGYSIEEIQIILEQYEARHVDNIQRFLEAAEKRAHVIATDANHWCEAFAVSIAEEFKALEGACDDRGNTSKD